MSAGNWHDLSELPAVLMVEEVQTILRVSRSTVYELIDTPAPPTAIVSQEKLRGVKVGRGVRVLKSDLLKYLGVEHTGPVNESNILPFTTSPPRRSHHDHAPHLHETASP